MSIKGNKSAALTMKEKNSVSKLEVHEKAPQGFTPQVHLSDEHQSYMWATSKDIETIALMDGAKEALQHYQARVIKKTGKC